MMNQSPRNKSIGLALSGGGFRAIAFHLGCLRSLNKRGILDHVGVISGVSGGSILAAMYAYSHDSFDEFDKRAMHLLKRGLTKDIVAHWLLLCVGSIGTFIFSGVPALAANATRFILNIMWRMMPIQTPWKWGRVIKPPFKRWVSRTDALEAALSREEIVGKKKLSDSRRNNLHIVINSCDLLTNTAFRYGSRETGCYPHGTIINNDEIEVSQAVAASAAYPIFFPIIERQYDFIGDEGKQCRRNVYLTDGGVYDNLGLLCFEPGIPSIYSCNAFAIEYIICCSAGAGTIIDETRPYWWPARVLRFIDSTYRKFMTDGYKYLHLWKELGKIKGFTLSYLGQIDDRLPNNHNELIKREDVIDYPTNFSSMRDTDINILAKRGEQLTDLLISHYCPELIGR